MHEPGLIFTIAVSLCLAFVLGLLAFKLRLSPVVGYLVAGVCISPHTPGVVADTQLASELSEIGVILLMFGVGLHFSIKDLLATSRIAFLGALPQTVVCAVGAMLLARLWGWAWGPSFVIGVALSVASTIVVISELDKRHLTRQAEGKATISWLLAQDMLVVLLLALLPALAPMLRAPQTDLQTLSSVAPALGIAVAKTAVFIAAMLFVGRRFFPWVMNKVAETGSRELFTLFVIGVPIGISLFAAHLFGVSLALGAFLAGMVMNESELSHHAAARAMPLQDAFAVLFFVSTGMAFTPSILLTHTWQILSAVAFTVIFTPLVTFALLVFVLRYSSRVASVVAPSLAQIGEFSLVLATMGVRLQILPAYAYATIIGAALITICLHSPVFSLLQRFAQGIKLKPKDTLPGNGEEETSQLRNHVVLVGYGRVGSAVGKVLRDRNIPFIVIEEDRGIVNQLRKQGVLCIFGNADIADVLRDAGAESCRLIIVTSPDAFATRHICDQMSALNKDAVIIVRTHSESETEYLQAKPQVKLAVFAESEVAKTLSAFVEQHFG